MVALNDQSGVTSATIVVSDVAGNTVLGGAGLRVVLGTSGADTIDASAASGNNEHAVLIVAGAGDDVVQINPLYIQASDTFSGGAGNDRLELTGPVAELAPGAFAQIKGFESIRLSDAGAFNADTLQALDAASAAQLDVPLVTSLTGSAASLLAVYGSAGISGLGNEAVVVGGTVGADSVNAIALATTGVVTATVSAERVSSLLPALANAVGTDALTLVVSPETTGASSADSLKALDDRTSLSIAVNASSIAGGVADLHYLYVGPSKDHYSGLGDEAVVVTGGPVGADSVNAIANKTLGVVTATVSAAPVSSLLTALSHAVGTDALTLVVSPETTGASSADSLKALDGKTARVLRRLGAMWPRWWPWPLTRWVVKTLMG
ncbi:MAG: hypothetical protein EB072_03795 [Betaproteobacteria bacterium]|nr:hypothetical protein [Betaproteobacteria bacterium]